MPHIAFWQVAIRYYLLPRIRQNKFDRHFFQADDNGAVLFTAKPTQREAGPLSGGLDTPAFPIADSGTLP
jgi:hypothetical protein